MIEQIPYLTSPDWLMKLTAESMLKQPFPLSDVLDGSLYYPGAGTDGKPVRWLAGNTYSFVYTDYMVDQSGFLDALNHDDTGFKGYRILGTKNVTMQDLVPNGWSPMPPNRDDGNPRQWNEHLAQPFCIWAILERQAGYGAEHGPERFSLLYLCGEGVASYQALYNSNKIKPKILFLIQHGFGGNWTDFEDPNGILARSVAVNPAGMPDWLIGRHQRRHESCWPEYYPAPHICYLGDGAGYFAAWPLGKAIHDHTN